MVLLADKPADRVAHTVLLAARLADRMVVMLIPIVDLAGELARWMAT
jgi:hypothetical protein